MDATAIKAIQNDATTKYINEVLAVDLNNIAVAIPDNAKLQSIEAFQLVPNKYRAKFITHLLGEFLSYIDQHGSSDTDVFIDAENEKAKAIIDLGNPLEPKWGKHTATLILKKTPSFAALLQADNAAFSQQLFIDFIEDYNDHIAFFTEEDGNVIEISNQKAISILRKLTVNSSSNNEHQVSNFAASASAMEKIEVKAGEYQLPSYFIFNSRPYEGFSDQSFKCSLRTVHHEKNVNLKYRIMQKESQLEIIAEEFRHHIKNGINEADIYIAIGTLDYQ
ncbi:DUF2303 family protein [Methylomonas sp. AM2-LC]|uniref:DUF2303 family protein n=1 Tax=Methylomonas sp. AM2-LC TaxID=3153301 RepID=UPI0032642241